MATRSKAVLQSELTCYCGAPDEERSTGVIVFTPQLAHPPLLAAASTFSNLPHGPRHDRKIDIGSPRPATGKTTTVLRRSSQILAPTSRTRVDLSHFSDWFRQSLASTLPVGSCVTRIGGSYRQLISTRTASTNEKGSKWAIGPES
jgi:hypothetical protein